MKTRLVCLAVLIISVFDSIAGYDPSIGRWLSRDPILELGGINLYRYVGNDPINYLDPDGLNPDAASAMASGFGVNLNSYQGNIPSAALPQIGNRADNSHPNAQDVVAYQSAAALGIAGFAAPPVIAAAPGIAQNASACLRVGAFTIANAALANPDKVKAVAETAFAVADPNPPTGDASMHEMIASAINGLWGWITGD